MGRFGRRFACCAHAPFVALASPTSARNSRLDRPGEATAAERAWLDAYNLLKAAGLLAE